MNPFSGNPTRTGFFGHKQASETEKAGAYQGRRRFQPVLQGLEGRQLLSTSTIGTVATFKNTSQTQVGGLVADSRGDLFGTTAAEPTSQIYGDGTVFEIPHGSDTPITLGSFNGKKGYGISGLTMDSQGNLYGTTSGEGGANSDGTVFEIPRGAQSATTLATFNGANGEFPNGVTVDGQGNLFGTSSVGFTHGLANAFEIPAGSGTITPISVFTNPGAAPNHVVIDSQGNLFGTDNNGGPNGDATVYEVTRGSDTPITIASFHSLNGEGVSGLTMDSQGNLYGTTEDGGTYGDGMVFEIPKGSNSIITLASFNNLDGEVPNPNVGVVVDGQGNLYGATVGGGTYNDGTLFEIARGSNSVTTLAPFNDSDGITGSDTTSLTLDGRGNLLGAIDGSGNAGGKVYKFSLGSQAAVSTVAPTPLAASGTNKTVHVVAKAKPTVTVSAAPDVNRPSAKVRPKA